MAIMRAEKYAWLLPLDLIPFAAVKQGPKKITLIVFPSSPRGPETSRLSDGEYWRQMWEQKIRDSVISHESLTALLRCTVKHIVWILMYDTSLVEAVRS